MIAKISLTKGDSWEITSFYSKESFVRTTSCLPLFDEDQANIFLQCIHKLWPTRTYSMKLALGKASYKVKETIWNLISIPYSQILQRKTKYDHQAIELLPLSDPVFLREYWLTVTASVEQVENIEQALSKIVEQQMSFIMYLYLSPDSMLGITTMTGLSSILYLMMLSIVGI
jgi:hypothetical protein